MNYHSMSRADATKKISELESNPAAMNVITSGKKKSLFKRFLLQFSDFMIVVLLVAAAISFFISLMAGEKDFADPIIILVIVILNACIGVFEESRADNALEALKQMSAPSATVRRGGKIISVPSCEVRVGDTLILSCGDRVSADARLISSVGLEVDEAARTGEAMPVSKDADAVLDEFTPLAERKNMVFSATNIIAGRGEAIVCAIGMDTETGKIAELIQGEEEEMTPLQKKLAQTGKFLGIGALLICAVIFLMGLLRQIPPSLSKKNQSLST